MLKFATMRKLFVYILTTLLFFSVAHPCKDTAGCAPPEKQEVVDSHHHHCQQKQAQKDGCQSDGEEEGHCTPLCVCACCQAPVLLSMPYFPLPPGTSAISLEFPQPNESSYEFIANVWQPPRLS